MKATEKQKEQSRKYYQKNKQKQIASAKRYYQEHRESIVLRKKQYWQVNKERLNISGRKRSNRNRAILKREVLLHYGNGKLACVRCGFSDMRALSIDHLGGNGNKHRKCVNNIYRWLKRESFPDGYQTLCMNCQFIKKLQEGENAYGTQGGNYIA